MHRSNNAVVMQTEQLGRIEALEEELRSSRGKVADLEQRMVEQDRVIAQLVGDNLDHLQANMRLTAHINSSTERAERMEHRLGQVASVVMGFLEGRMEGLLEEGETSESSGSGGSDASGGDCHRYDFLVCLYWNGLSFFKLFQTFILYLGLITTPMFSMFT